jgi:hypothetical protein
MADFWYYAEDGQQLGPFSMAELLLLLANIPRRVRVWRHGSADWKPVEEAREIAEQLLQSSRNPVATPVAPPARGLSNLILHGGRIIDPSQKLDAVCVSPLSAARSPRSASGSRRVSQLPKMVPLCR